MVNPAALLCGGGRLGNGVCPQPGACCSKWGHCGTGHDYCSLDKGLCFGGACVDYSGTPLAGAPAPPFNGTSAAFAGRRGRGG